MIINEDFIPELTSAEALLVDFNIGQMRRLAEGMDSACPSCGIPRQYNQTCHVCDAMRNAVERQPGLASAQKEWEAENVRRLAVKNRKAD